MCVPETDRPRGQGILGGHGLRPFLPTSVEPRCSPSPVPGDARSRLLSCQLLSTARAGPTELAPSESEGDAPAPSRIALDGAVTRCVRVGLHVCHACQLLPSVLGVTESGFLLKVPAALRTSSRRDLANGLSHSSLCSGWEEEARAGDRASCLQPTLP